MRTAPTTAGSASPLDDGDRGDPARAVGVGAGGGVAGIEPQHFGAQAGRRDPQGARQGGPRPADLHTVELDEAHAPQALVLVLER
ncbi:hypothetical protein ACFYPB_41140 [Streptomyces olivaceoviridis]|uniref:hypothetical protein n=1 Tax=Streptomyces olivaceoviridis TaxID=1921 RepID=UPI0036C251F3